MRPVGRFDHMNDVFIFVSTALVFLIIGIIAGVMVTKKIDWRQHKASQRFQRSVLGGKFSEHIATLLPHFPEDLKASEARFIGDPVDFIFFKGKDESNVSEIVFLEVKSGNSQLTEVEKQVREAIQQRKVTWHEYRVPMQITHSLDSMESTYSHK